MTSTAKRSKIILFGDSITQQAFSAAKCGWGTYISDRYQRRADVLNRGFSGYNSGWFLRFAATSEGKTDLFEHDNVKLVTIFFGANDASDSVLKGREHVPLETYKSNIRDIVSLIRSNFGKSVNIILISPPPVCHEGRVQFLKERYKATDKLERTLKLSGKYAQSLNEVACGLNEVASELGIPFLDLWTKMQITSFGERDDWSDFFVNGLHLSASGNKFVGESVVKIIDYLLPDLSVQPCPESGNMTTFF